MGLFTDEQLEKMLIMTAVGSYQTVSPDAVRKHFLDLDLVFYLGGPEGKIVRVTKQVLKSLDKTVDELYVLATKDAEYWVENLGQVVGAAKDICNTYVVRNKKAMYYMRGGYADSAIADRRCLANIAGRLCSDLYIIPSSIHEVLVCPKETMSVSDVKREICEVNNSIVEPENRLSYNLYQYSRKTGEITIA